MKKNYFKWFAVVFFFSATASAQSPGDVVVTEFMADPAAVADASGEWFEILNVSSNAIDINGWHIKDSGSNNHTINNSGSLMMVPGAILVLGNNGNISTNGGVTVDYTYSSFTLTNTSDEIIVTDLGGNVIDSVAYNGTTSGKSWNLDPTHFNATDNDNFAYWCHATTPYGSGDLGTPGSNNISCISAIPSFTNDNSFSIRVTENELLVHSNAAAGKQSWDVIDISGRIISSGAVSEKTDNFSVPLQGLAAGIYSFRVKGNGRAIKFIVD